MPNRIKVAAIQTNPVFMNPGKNLEKIIGNIKDAAKQQAKLIVFPECCLSGYVFDSRQEALPFAESIPGPTTGKLVPLCKDSSAYIVLGLLEKDGEKLFNSAAFIGPDGLIGKYRKNHLPFLGVDRFVDRSDKPFEVYQTPIGNIGIEICYDITFPESTRIMMLMGAEILALPTNFPVERTESVIKCIIPARVIENGVFIVAADRVGQERGSTFAGRSRIVGPTIMVEASADKEEIIYAEIDPESARRKHFMLVPGKYEVDIIKDRRPELYGKLTEPINDDNSE